MDTTRQKKISKLIQQELSMILLKRGAEFMGKMISVTVVRVTPDLGLAKVYLSFFPPDNREDALELVRQSASSLRYELGNLVKNQLRKIPELVFYIDDSLDYAARIDELLKE